METFAEYLKELMGKYNKLRTAWIKKIGSDEGFNAWFSMKLGIQPPKEETPEWLSQAMNEGDGTYKP